MTSAPISAAYRIASEISSNVPLPFASRTRTAKIFVLGAVPAIPVALLVSAEFLKGGL